MAIVKSVVSLSSQAAVLVVLLPVIVATGKAQMSCTTQLLGLNLCRPFVVPGAIETDPSPQCCGALQSVQHDCLCSTLRLALQLPSQCNLPPLYCAN
ncbi:hypothetical protein F3Y22_tig00110447pilonHSYRG00007 [Hibiscus syriacus]|uniref:Bifunctional inhibitor/plant lipid transfer protein/seed storage helical domain-containing protein n=1 Tax=Hibiscus syriacus TaxID=106335 RepID=A0A6A3AP72_HIBSY|nr:protein 108-like [Hibiscus syriacus]KAE8704672.1 hypothetical protein F3Y22_tig00110447pilonHSYRG00007 [Hibiscus syriacus]